MKRLSKVDIFFGVVLNVIVLPGAGTVLFGRTLIGFLQAALTIPFAVLIFLYYISGVISEALPAELHGLYPVINLPQWLITVSLITLICVWFWTLVHTVCILIRQCKAKEEEKKWQVSS